MKVSAGKSQARSGDTGVRGNLAVQLVGVQCTRDGTMVVKKELNRFNYTVEDETDLESGLTVPVVYRKKRDYPAQPDDEGAHKKNGKWVVTVEPKRIDPDRGIELEDRYGFLFDHKIFLRCKVIWPDQFYGKVVPLSVVIKGIEFPDGPNEDNVRFVTRVERGNISRFMQLCMDFGFQPGALDPDSPLFDPGYLQPFASDCQVPYTPEQIVEKLLVPILVRHGQDGHLVNCATSDKSHFIVPKTTQPIAGKKAEEIWEHAQELAVDDSDDDDPQAPFFDDDDPQVEDGSDDDDPQDLESLRAEIRTLAGAGVFQPIDLCDLLDSWGVEYTDEEMLSSISGDVMRQIIKHYSPEEKAPTL